MASYNINEVEPIEVRRIFTGFPELDWLYGYSTYEGKIKWGIPMKSISLWSGESGTGKSRTAIALAKNLANSGLRVLYFQNETDLGTFSQWIKNGVTKPQNFRISDDKKLEDQIRIIERDNPHIVFIDSVNMIEEFKSGTKKDIELIVNSFKEICKKRLIHIILIAQLNQDGSVKGSSTLPHLVDIAFNLKKDDGLDGLFSIEVGIKHRYGRTGPTYKTIWEHEEDGIVCLSESRLLDKKWNGGKKFLFPVLKEKKREGFFDFLLKKQKVK